MNTAIQHFCVLLVLSTFCQGALLANHWEVPVAGNAFQVVPEPSSRNFERNGPIRWNDDAAVFSIYFHVDQTAEIQLGLLAETESGKSLIQASIDNEKFNVPLDQATKSVFPIGSIKAEAGYVRIDLRGLQKDGESFGKIHAIVVDSQTPNLTLHFVESNEGNMFYWGRRGPSVHLRYRVPRGIDVQYGYSEVTVPDGEDPIGSYFMANGFGEGYFGFQVNHPNERRILFSVWSPFKTDDPNDIPPEQRIELLGKGPDVRTGKFGNEGSGGQSFLIYPWHAGKTYQFLTSVEPTEDGSTIYTSWFAEKTSQQWRLIASFRRPRTTTHFTGFHSFLENFSPSYGHLHRRELRQHLGP